MKIINFAETRSLVNQFMTELRDENIQKDMLRFRTNIQRIGEIMAYEISQTLDYKPVTTKTCLGKASGYTVADTVVLATILRAGLPLHQGMPRMPSFRLTASISATTISAFPSNILQHLA